MLDRRSTGIASIHTVLIGVEAIAWWLVLAWATPLLRFMAFTTLLPRPAYPLAIALGVAGSMGAAWRLKGNLAALGWIESAQLAARQTGAIAGAVFVVVVVFKDPGISRMFLAEYFGTLPLLLVALNRTQPRALVALLYGARARVRTLLVGGDALFPDWPRWLAARERLGLAPVGRVRYDGAVAPLDALPIAGEFADLKSAIATTGAQQVLMLHLPKSADDLEQLVRACAGGGCRLLIQNDLAFRLSQPLRLLVQDDYSFFSFQDEPLEDPVNRCLKRLFDLALALFVVGLVLPPLAVVVALVQRRQAPGPLFYRQVRSGRAGRAFSILKFRTMYHAAEPSARQTAPNDERIFPLGRWLRRTSLDELPQFLNVLRGEMSVVGPRPHFVQHDAQFADAVGIYRMRFFVKPGITGLAQSHGLRGEIRTVESIRERIRLDLLYIHNWSVWFDLAIILRTLRQLVAPPPEAR